MGRAMTSFWHSRSRRRAASAPATPRPEPDGPPVGCMSMVHYLIFTPGAGCVGRPPTGVGVSSASASGVVTPHHTGLHLGGEPGNSKSGFEAPRNSLDLDADADGGDFRIGVQIEPVFDALAARAVATTGGGCARRGSKGRPATAPSSEAGTPRTPSLVARLMGIDGLPDDDDRLLPLSPAPGKQRQHDKENATPTTPTVGTHKEKKKRVIPESMTRRDRDREPLRSLSCNVQQQSRSLPDTPRASTSGSASARASWDGPRLSLQALRDMSSMPSSPTSSSSASGKKKKKSNKEGGRRRRDDETAAKEHAREILRQAKETVASRRTCSSNSSSSKHSSSNCNKENVLTSPAARAPVPDMEMEEQDKLVVVVHGSSSCRPMAAPASKPGGNNPQSCQRQSSNPSPVRVPLAPRQQQQQQAPPPPPPQRARPSRPPPPPPPLDPPPPTRARRPDGCERFATRIKKPPGGGPSSASTPSSASPSRCAPPPTATTVVGTLEEDPEYGYLRKVLERGGFMRPPPCRRPARAPSSLSLKQQQQQQAAAWPPVDPIVFHLLELELPAEAEEEEEGRLLGPLRHRWNRKLLFHAAQEVLAGLLLSPAAPPDDAGSALLGKVWATVRGFPGADCRVVGDIDALVAADMEREAPAAAAWGAPRHPGVAEAVADRVLDALLAECVAEESWPPVVGATCGGRGEVAVVA